MTSRSDDISGLLLVKGAATDASASDKEIPISAVLSAGASLAPSPVNPLPCMVSASQPLKAIRFLNPHSITQTLQTLY